MRMTMRRPHRLALAAAVLLSVAACTDETTTGPARATTPTAQAKAVAAGAQKVEGELGTGARYGLYLPAEWNGDLVLFAHGYCGFMPNQNSAADCFPGGDPSAVEFRDLAMARGYGVAWSSYSDWGMMVKDGELRTAQLKNLWTSKFGRPAHTYLVSISMGGAIIMHMAETQPQLYDGALPICGIVGGMAFQMNYYWTMKTLVNRYFPTVLPDRLMTTDEIFTLPGTMIGLAFTDPKMLDLAAVRQLQLQYRTPVELGLAVAYPVMFAKQDRFAGNFIAAVHGHNFFENRDVWYEGTSDDVGLNAEVQRFAADPDALNLVNHWYEPKGNLAIPVLTLHTARDPIAPIMHEWEYAKLAAAQGKSAFLVQRSFDNANHCDISAADQAQGLFDLAAWVKTGVKPTT